MNWLLRIKNKLIQVSPEQLYLSTFVLYLISVTIKTTTFVTYYPHWLGTLVQLFTLLVMLSKLVFLDELSLNQILIDLGLVSLGIIVSLTSGVHSIIVTVLLVLEARQVEFKKIVKVYLIVIGSILISAFFSAEVGLIQNITFDTADGLRQSFGVLYTTDFAAHIFYLCCAYLYLRARTFRLIDLVPVGCGFFIIYRYTQTMTDIMALITLVIMYLIYVYRWQLGHIGVFSIILRYSFLAMPIFSLIILHLSATFDYRNPVYQKLNDLLSTRLALGNGAILAYGFKLFGQSPVNINGWGGDRVSSFNQSLGNLTYFFIDSSYMNLMISYGLLFTIVVILGTSYFLYRRIKKNDYLLPGIMLAVALASAIDQHLLEITYNVFLLAYFAELPVYSMKLTPSFTAQAWDQVEKTTVARSEVDDTQTE
ncbi:polysaccharide biosynthesis protein [Lactiplantibacillus nangangensis]|uniref:Polysaccharide biosynthesis protein n=1 Tax=Lactiplantibacillus nangangensis TaxID=2559917 RepID=A0ABW1SHN2_9LACO